MMKQKVALIGLDGATWTVIDPLIQKGLLPTLKRLRDSGCSGTLESVIPPVTGPAWVSMATGKNPGKTGVCDFANKLPNSYGVRFVDSSVYRKGGALWDRVARYGGRSVVIAYPMLFPPYRTNGLMISGVPSPQGDNITFPPELKSRLDEITGDYEISVPYHHPKYEDRELFLSDLRRVLDKSIKVSLELLREDWNLFITVFSSTDWLQHSLWGVSGPLQEQVTRIWSRLDEALAEILHQLGPDTNVLIVSDHGFGPQEGVFNLPLWLASKGYLRLKGGLSTKTTIDRFRESAFYESFKKLLPRQLRRRALASLREKPAIRIDYSQSQVYVCNHSIPFGAIYLNLRDRDPEGILDAQQGRALKEQIKRDLMNLPAELGRDLRVQIFDKDEVYRGPYAESAPDILFTLDDWSCVVNNSELEQGLYRPGPYSPRHVGSHRLHGIFLASGPDFKQGVRLEGARLYDIAPTVLELMGLPTDSDMDGRVLSEALREEAGGEERRRSSRQRAERDRLRTRLTQLKSMKRI